MYITSDLFGSTSDPGHSHCDLPNNSTPTWNPMADSQSQALGKRKKRDMGSADGPSSNNYTSFQRISPPDAKAILKRQILNHTIPDNNIWAALYTQASTTYPAPESRPLKQLKRTSPKRVPSLVKSTSHLMDIEPEAPTSSSSSRTLTTLDLRPCHICYTAPKRRTDLENYHECKRCQEQTCFICVRHCADGCREKICRKCCVEVGEEGDTLCLGCYARTVNS